MYSLKAKSTASDSVPAPVIAFTSPTIRESSVSVVFTWVSSLKLAAIHT